MFMDNLYDCQQSVFAGQHTILFHHHRHGLQASGSASAAKQPEGNKGKDEPQYFGTVVNDPSAASSLPVLEW